MSSFGFTDLDDDRPYAIYHGETGERAWEGRTLREAIAWWRAEGVPEHWLYGGGAWSGKTMRDIIDITAGSEPRQ